MKRGGFPPETVSVAPTSTTVVEVDCRGMADLTLYVKNIDGSQTFVGVVERWMVTGQTPAPTNVDAFFSLGPGVAAMPDIDVRGTAYLRLVGTMSGAGGDVSVSGADRRQQP